MHGRELFVFRKNNLTGLDAKLPAAETVRREQAKECAVVSKDEIAFVTFCFLSDLSTWFCSSVVRI